MDNLKNIVESTLVPHTAFQTASERLEQCYRYAESACEPICLAITAESRTGKSRLLEECCANHPSERKPEGLYVPILRVKTPSKPRVKGLVELMLRAMGDPRWHVGAENEKTTRLQVLMREAGTRMVMIDEFQHFYDKVSRKVMFHVSDWLKILVDDCKVALVVAGLPDCRAVIEQNEQLSGRFLSPIVLPRFDWTLDEQREEFVAILEAFQNSLGEHFDIPRLDSGDMAFRCYCGTGGLIGYLTKFLRQAVWDAIDENRKSISLEDLATAHDRAVWSKHGFVDVPSPFRRTFQSHPTDDLLARVRRLGIPVVDVTTRKSVMADARPALRSVLSAS